MVCVRRREGMVDVNHCNPRLPACPPRRGKRWADKGRTAGPRRNSQPDLRLCSLSLLLCRYKVELAGAFLIKESALGFVAAAPVFVAARDEYIFAGANTLLAGFVLV
jgi:hypothetical protein